MAMDWNSPLGILRRAMGIERDGYRFYVVGYRGDALLRGLMEGYHLNVQRSFSAI